MAEQLDSFKIEQFGGMLPAWDDHLLPQGQGSFAQNCYLFSGALGGWRTPKVLRSLLNSASRYVYRVPTITNAIASATLVFIANPSQGDQFTVGEEIYTFTATVKNAYDVLIGGNAGASAVNTYAALTLDDGKTTNQGTLYGVGTVANPAIDQRSPTTKNSITTVGALSAVKIVAPDFGAAYNTTLVGESTATVRLNWQFNNVTTTTLQGGVNSTFDSTISGTATWLEFADPDTNVMRSPVVDDKFDRYYFASPSLAPMYNTHDRITAGLPPWLLGVPAPGCAPTVEIAGGGDTATLGFPTSTTAAISTPGSNILYLVPVTPDGAMILNDVTLMPAQTAASANIVALLYNDLNGSPHELMNVGQQVTGVTAGVQVASAFLNPTGLLMNVQYWIGFATDTAFAVQQADGGTKGVVGLNTYTNGPPVVINNLALGAPDLQVWGDLTTSSVLEARVYVYTYVTEYDEESPPSPTTLLTGWSNGTWTIGLFTPPPDQLGITRNIVTTRIYRTISAVAGETTFFHVADVPVAQATYSDVIDDSVVVTNLQLSSQLYFPPPENLQGIISMPNGMTVGFVGNEIWFAQPYLPHAWPPSYVLTTEFPIVGLGVSGTSVVACTSGTPYIATGVSPGGMTLTKTNNPEPCSSRGSVLGNSDGVYYCSPNGLILVTAYGAVTNTTELWVTREKWQQLVPQKNVRAIFLVSSYFAFGTVFNADNSVAQRGFTIELNPSDAQSFTIWPQPGGHRLGFNLLTAPNGFDIYNVEADPWSGVALLVQNNAVYYYDFTDPAPVMQPYTWRSKKFQQHSKENFEAMRFVFQVPPGTPPLSAKRNEAPTDDASWNTLGANQYGIVRVIADNQIVTTRELRVPQELLRILSGFKHETWQFEITARVPISNFKIGTSVKELGMVK